MAEPLPPPKRPSLGPDAWWNPLSPSWPPTAAGRAVREATSEAAAGAGDRLAAEANALLDEAMHAGTAIVDGATPDPLPYAIAIIGAPTWGYWAPSAVKGIASLAAVGAVALIVYKHRSKKRK